MKKIFGIKLGGLHHKILALVLVFLLALIGVFTGVSLYQGKQLSNVVRTADTDQQNAIRNVSGDIMHSVVGDAMTKTNALQAYIADDMFLDLKTDVATLQSLATGLLEHKDGFLPYTVFPPNKANEGKLSAQVLCEQGVNYKKSAYLGTVAHMSDTMIAMCSNSEYLSNCFVGLSDGALLCIDDRPTEKFDENGKIKPFPVRERPWYKLAAEMGELCFTGIEKDTYTDNIGVECVAPVYLKGELVGVVGCDLFLNAMEEYVGKSSNENGGICVINNEGQVIFAPKNNSVFKVETSDMADDLRESDNDELAEFLDSALSDRTQLTIVNAGDKEYYMAGAPMNTVGWAVISFIEKDLTEKPAQMLLTEYDKINSDATARFDEGAGNSKKTTIIMISVIFILGIIGALVVAGKIVRPIERMTGRICEINGKDLDFDMEDTYKTGDEIQVLAETLTTLSKRTREYISEITRITAEKERIGAELNVATRIQADMLPTIFPAFPGRSEFDIYASMTPAKEVGGDFYDFFFLDDDHLAMVMADVSGKGVPAALFMVIAKTLIKNCALAGEYSPSKILAKVNDQLCEGNDAELFVTVWLAIIDISTGKGMAANAGHEHPAVRRKNGKFELVKYRHSPAVATVSGMTFMEHGFELNHGDTIFVYTDGVPEATNGNNQLFGTDRMLEALNRCKENNTHDLLCNVKEAVDSFVGDAPKFDDLTMLGFTYYGKEEK